ncbi:hypothetical protein NDU88_003607 [Pleurodeles waltl]|uniref:Uncharacterized protein n=1 Tax=Pleurodeles waltl TaxID=8319 RepID=A0AAV7VDS9_PLEWA|nr:hypothetical protein NDU88_003607 [Pleurodeles waltl]
MRVRWRPRATIQARSLNPAIIEKRSENIQHKQAVWGRVSPPPKKKLPLTSSRLAQHKMAAATEQEISYSRGPRPIEERKGLSHFCH